jgi:hypothetical protein
MDLKDIVQGSADLLYVRSGGIAIYKLTSLSGKTYRIDIDLSNKNDVGDSARFELHYDKAIILMRWIRKEIENGTLIEL